MAFRDRCNRMLIRLERVISEKAVCSGGTYNSFKPALLGASRYHGRDQTVNPTRQSDEEDENPRIGDDVSWDDEENPQYTDSVPWDPTEQLIPIMRMIGKAKYNVNDIEVMHHIRNSAYENNVDYYVDSDFDRVWPEEGEIYIRFWDPTLEQNQCSIKNMELELESVICDEDENGQEKVAHLVDCAMIDGNTVEFSSYNAHSAYDAYDTHSERKLFTITQEAKWRGFLELPSLSFYQPGEQMIFESVEELETIITDIIENQERIEDMDKKETEQRKQELLQRMIREGTL